MKTKLNPSNYQKLAPENATHVLSINGERYFAHYDKDAYAVINRKGRKTGKRVGLGDSGWFISAILSGKKSKSLSGDAGSFN